MLAAVSGGPDSTALLLALRESGIDVVAGHFDHALRSSSSADAEHVARLCEALGVDLIAQRRTEPLARGSVQAAARAARYAFLERARQDAGADLIATAHTATDQVETILINLARGTGPRGLRGIAAQNGLVIRPLLGVTRADVVGYLAGYPEITPLEDPSNASLRYLRARVRHLLVPRLSEASRAAILRIATHAQAAAENVDHVSQAQRLRDLYAAACGARPALSRTQLATMDRLLRGRRTGASLSLPGSITFRVLPDGTPLLASQPPQISDPQLRERDCPGCAEDDAAAVHLAPGRISVGTRTPGLRIRPLGGRGTRKLQDLFVDAKVPRHERDAYPLVFLDGQLAWVPGIAVDERKVTPKSLQGRHVWLGRGSPRPMVRSEH